jgi:hypothetical protein
MLANSNRFFTSFVLFAKYCHMFTDNFLLSVNTAAMFTAVMPLNAQ